MALGYTRQELVNRAFSILDVTGAEESAAGADLTYGITAFNHMVLAWQKAGIFLWKDREATIFLQAGQPAYNLGATGDHASLSHVKTELSVAASATDVNLTVDSTTGMTADDHCGIVLDNGTLQWTTIASVDSGTTITIDDALEGDTAIDNEVFTYTTIMGRPFEVRNVRLHMAAGTERPVRTILRESYFATAARTAQGSPGMCYYDPQMTLGVLYLNPAPDSVSDRINLTAQLTITEFGISDTAPDFPAEWYDALTWGLALRMAAPYKVPVEAQVLIKTQADEMLSLLVVKQKEAEGNK